MGTLNISIQTTKDVSDYAVSGQPRNNLKKLSNIVKGLNSGVLQGSIDVNYSTTDPAAASQTTTCDQSAATADDVVTIIGVDLTAKASGASTDEFNIGSTDAEMATNLGAAINAQATLSKYFTATVSAAVVTVTCNFKGSIGNYLIASTATVNSGTPFAFSNSGAFTGGTGGPETEVLTIGR